MNPFQKNPFASNNANTKIVGNKIILNETQKIENIKETMLKTKMQPIPVQEKKQSPQISVKEKIDILKNIQK